MKIRTKVIRYMLGAAVGLALFQWVYSNLLPNRSRRLTAELAEQRDIIHAQYGADNIHNLPSIVTGAAQTRKIVTAHMETVASHKTSAVITSQKIAPSRHSSTPVPAPRRHVFVSRPRNGLRDDIFLGNSMEQLFVDLGKERCFIEGTNITATEFLRNRYCVCNSAWYGQYCSKPKLLKQSEYPHHYGIGLRDTPRKLIYAIVLNHEFDFLEARVHELHSVVDAFVLLESNYTSYGDPKDFYLWNMLRKGFLKKFHSKILYVQLTTFPEAALTNGWVIERLLRNTVTTAALTKIHNVDKEDLLMLTDADELPTRESLLFLKLHYGYPEPVGFNLRHNVFGFMWREPDVVTQVYSVVTVGLLKVVLGNRGYNIRRLPGSLHDNARNLDHFTSEGGRVQPWRFGSKFYPEGHHCSWCFTPEGILQKMKSAHISDRPRWGDFEDRANLPYIRKAVASGLWFDNKKHLLPVERGNEPGFAPRYFLSNENRFSYLLKLSPVLLKSNTIVNAADKAEAFKRKSLLLRQTTKRPLRKTRQNKFGGKVRFSRRKFNVSDINASRNMVRKTKNEIKL